MRSNVETQVTEIPPIHNLEEMLDRLEATCGDGKTVSMNDLLEMVGKRSFGPILLLAGLIPASPLSGVPGLPSVAAILVFLVIVQMLFGQRFWLPRWLLERRMSRGRFMKALRFMRPPARWIDRFIHPRLRYLTDGVAVYLVALICALIALLMPPLELIPFANTVTGLALATFGLALIAHDGLLVILGLAFCAVSVGLTLTFQGS